MTKLVCKTCGSNGIEKKGELYECAFCGTKYSPDEAEKLSVQVVVKNDNSEKIEALLRAGKKSRDIGNWEAASKYYDEILGLDPDRWEAVYFSAFCTARNCKIAYIASSAKLVEKSLKPTYSLIKSHVPVEKQREAVREVVEHTNEITEMMYCSAINHYNGIDSQIRLKYRDEMISRWAAATDAARTSGMLIEELFGSQYSDIIALALRNAVNLFDQQGDSSKPAFNNALEILNKYDSNYIEQRREHITKNNNKMKTSGIVMLVIGVIVFFVGLFIPGDMVFLKWFLILFGAFLAIFGIAINRTFSK